MIRRLRHSEIDKAWWDARIAASATPLWYARSAVLDAAAPGWDALVHDGTGAVMPLTQDSKWGFRYLYQPFAIQRLGVFSPIHDAAEVGAFLHAIPLEYRLWDIYLHNIACHGEPADVIVEERSNMELPLTTDLETLRAAYGDSHKRGLRKWAGEGELHPIPVATFMDILATSTQFKNWGITPKQVGALRMLLHTDDVLEHVELIGLKRGVDWLAVGAFVTWGGRTIFLKGLSTEAGRGVFALHRVMDGAIARSVGRVATFDMAGGHATELRRFYAGFGASPTLYLHAGLNRLPQPLRWIKQQRDGA
jgi:hypothetical protein